MTPTQREVMEKLYDHDLWKGFEPERGETKVQGWNGEHPALSHFLSAAPGESAKIAIDLGVWKGQSTITLAKAMQNSGIDGCVIAVDTFLGSEEHWRPGRELFSRTNGYPDLYRTFLNNIWHAGVAGYVVPLPQSTDIAARILRRAGLTASLVHLDASHDYRLVLQDAEEYWQLLAPGGYLIGDDYDQSWPGVLRAADAFAARMGSALTINPPKWILQKPLAPDAAGTG